MIYRSMQFFDAAGAIVGDLSLDSGIHLIARNNDSPEAAPFDAITDLLYAQNRAPHPAKLQVALQNGEEIVVESIKADDNGESSSGLTTVQLSDIHGNPWFPKQDNPSDGAPGLPWSGFALPTYCELALLQQEHMDALGDGLSLESLSQMLAALADSGNPQLSISSARNWLDNRIVFIGRGGTPAKPLTRLRNRCNALEKELEVSRKVWREIREQLVAHEQLEEELNRLHLRRKQVERNLQTWEAHERAERLAEAESLLRHVTEATQECFSLSTARDFPTDITPALRQQESRFRTAQLQHERSQEELKALQAKLEQEDISLEEPEESQRAKWDVPEALADAIVDNTQLLQELGNQLETVQEQIEEAEMRLLQAQERSALMPDFSRFASDPVEWITQLTHSFEVAVRTRDEECAHLDQLQAEYDINRSRNAHAASLFDDFGNFHDALRNYEEQRQENREDQRAQSRQWQLLNLEYEEISERMPAFIWMALACGIFFIMTLAAYFYYQNPGIMISSVLMGVSLLYFAGNHLYAKKRLQQLKTELAMLDTSGEAPNQTQQDRNATEILSPKRGAVHTQNHKDMERIESLLQRSGCESTRELEAMYDTYTEAVAMLEAHKTVLEAARERAGEAEDRVPRLLERIQKTFQAIGVVIASEHEVLEESGNAIARYQEYREAKRRVSDYRSLLERHQQEYQRLMEEHAQTRHRLSEAENALKAHVKAHHFEPDPPNLPPTELIRQYKAYLDTQHFEEDDENQLREAYHDLTGRIDLEAAIVAEEEKAFIDLLGNAGVKRLDEWLEKESLYQQYQYAWKKRVHYENALEDLLQGRDITELRERVEKDSPLPPRPERPKEALRAEMEALGSAIAQRESAFQEQQMRLSQRQMNVTNPTLLEESLAWNRKRFDTLGIELEAASRALTLLDDATRNTRRNIIPGLVERITPHVEMLSGGKFHGIEMDDKFQIQLVANNGHAQQADGAVTRALLEQLYFAFRLALLQELTRDSEPIPMLLHEAFAGYDDWQLERTLRLLQRMTDDQEQVLVYSTRNDVVQAAEAVHAPVHYL